ncbi:MAG TPA: hypothetical protein VGB46_03225 [Flavisolibacter sp.]
MRKVFKSRMFILTALLLLMISAISYAAYKKGQQACTAIETCGKESPGRSGHMIWDALATQFVSAIQVR